MSKLSDILNNQDLHIDGLVLELEKEFMKFNGKLRGLLSKELRSAVITRAGIEAAFVEAGFEPLVGAFWNKYNSVFPLIREASVEMGVGLVLPERSLAVLDLVKNHGLDKMLNTKTTVIDSIIDAGLRHQTEGVPFRMIIKEMTDDVDLLGRRLGAEANTGIRIFQRVITSEQYRQAGIERFFYFGPRDRKNRDACASTLDSNKQNTGWTRDEIFTSQVDFYTGGGFNCRHRFVLITPETQSTLVESQPEVKRD